MEREKLFALLGDRPEPSGGQSLLLDQYTGQNMVIETLLLDLNGIEKVPAYFIKPVTATHPLPVVLYNHSHGGNYNLGKAEVLSGRDYLQTISFAEELTGMGYAVMAIDAWGFGDRSGKKESELFKEMLIKGQVMWGMMLYDAIHALDYLQSREDIDSERIGTIGMSMGGLMSWWLGSLDERIKVVIDIAAQVDLQTLLNQRELDRHGFYSYVPGLMKHFSTADIQSMIVPRDRLSLVGKDDPLCPIAGVNKLRTVLEQTYAASHHEAKFKQVITTGGHRETAHMRSEWIRFLSDRL